MVREVILLDTGVLIDHIRKPDKEKTRFYELSRDNTLVISAVTGFELLVGKNTKNADFTDRMLNDLAILPFHQSCMQQAVEIYRSLKLINQLIPPLTFLLQRPLWLMQFPWLR